MNTNACRDLHFKVTKGKAATKRKSKATRITIICERGKIYEDQVGKRGKDRKCTGTIKTSKAIVPEHRCLMYFNTYEQEDGRIFVRKNGGCNWEHQNHTKTPKTMMRDGIGAIPDDTLEMSKKLLAEHMDVRFVKEFIAIETGGIRLSDDSMKSLRNSVMLSASNGSDLGTAAAQLVHDLDEKEGCEYVMLEGSYEEAIDQVRVTKTRRRKVKKRAEMVLSRINPKKI